MNFIEEKGIDPFPKSAKLFTAGILKNNPRIFCKIFPDVTSRKFPKRGAKFPL